MIPVSALIEHSSKLDVCNHAARHSGLDDDVVRTGLHQVHTLQA